MEQIITPIQVSEILRYSKLTEEGEAISTEIIQEGVRVVSDVSYQKYIK